MPGTIPKTAMARIKLPEALSRVRRTTGSRDEPGSACRRGAGWRCDRRRLPDPALATAYRLTEVALSV